MDENKLSALKRCYPTFVQSLNTAEIIDHLIGGDHISRDEYERITAKDTPMDKARAFLDFLFGKSNEAFKCFQNALSEEQPFLAKTLEEQLEKAPFSKSRQLSLTDIHQTLLRGAVPDRPTAYINRSQTIGKLTDGFRWLGGKFRPVSLLARQDGSLDNDAAAHSDIPTNAWFLVYGPPGQGKSVMTAAVLRQNRQLLTDTFSGGVVWLRVGEKRGVEQTQQVIDVLSALIEHVNSLPSQSRCIRQGSEDKREEPYRGCEGDVSKMTSLLHKLLIARQYRSSGVLDTHSVSPASLLLIVLDDVWDDCVVNALGPLPAAFVVTSRDMNILQRVLTPVRMERVEADMDDGEVASLLATRASISRDCLMNAGVYAELPAMCRGSPLAASLLGGLLASPTFELARYLGPRGFRSATDDVILDWSKVRFPSWYTYESLDEAISASLDRLSKVELERYRQFVIFEDDCSLTEDVYEIYWSCTKEEAVDTLQRLHRFSLVQCRREDGSGRNFFSVPNLQLDLLRTTVPTRRQQICHCQFVDNYKARFGGQWNQLADFKLIHTYFCRSVGEHMLKAGRLNGLIDLLTDLQFICARLLVLGSSAVLADFRRYRPVFQRVGRINDWHMYLHFLQTTAYQLINPDRLVRELHRRARSPTRPGSLCDVGGGGSGGGGGRHGAVQSMTPDALGMGVGAGGGSGGSCGSHYHFYHHSSPSPPTFRRNDTVDRQRCISRLPHKDLMVKGLDLLQLGLMFPRDNAVFQQSLNILKAVDAAACKASVPPPPKYYWYWSNSNSADSELVWATRTGKDKITAIAHEVDYSSLPPSLRRRAKPSGDRSINRRFVGTSDGRIIILDVTSGYEVAVHQVHRPSVAVMAISLLPGNHSCLSCGADGRMIVSNLPPLDAFLKSPSVGGSFNRSSMVSDMGVTDLDESYFTTIDVDDDGEADDDAFFDVSSEMGGKSSLSPPSSSAPPVVADVGVSDDRGTAPRSSSPVLQEDEFPIYTVAPTVLANLPSSFEIRRNTQVANSLASRQAVDSSTPEDETAVQQCIALSPLGTCLLFSDSPGSSTPTAVVTATAATELTLTRQQMHENSPPVSLPPVDQKPIPLTIYSILAQSQAKFTLVKSRELLLPAQRGERVAQVTVATASISFDDSLLIAGLSNGRLWIFSLDEIGWVACIASSIPLKANPLRSALMSARTPRPRPERSPLATNTSYCDPKLVDFALTDGKVAKACIFIRWPNQTRAPVTPGGWAPPDNPLVAASIDNLVLVWSFENKLPESVEDLQNPETIVTSSRVQFCLPCPPSTTITTLDSQPFGNFCLIAAGLTTGRAIIWSLPERCKIFDVCAHGSSVTSVRLSPYGFCRSPAATPTTSPAGPSHTFDLVAVTTAAEDGVVKAWEFHWPSPKEPQSANMSPILSGDCSPSRQRRGWLEKSVNVAAFVREQPFPLWASVYSVVFGTRGEFYAIGRIKASCSLQLLFRLPQATGLSVESDCQPLHCVELSLTTCHRRRPIQNQLLPTAVATTSSEQVAAATATTTTTSAFQAVNRIVKQSPVPSCAAFSDDMRLLVVGFENGTIQVLQMNCPKDPLRGFKPYRNFSVSSKNNLPEGGSGDCSRSSSRLDVVDRDLPLDIVSTAVKIIHLSLWTPPADFEEPELELVVAVATAGGTVHVWEVMHVKSPEEEDGDRISCAKAAPMKQWVRIHLPMSTSSAPSFSTPTFTPLLFGEAEAADQPVVWFRFFANLEPLQKCTEWRARLAWLSAGRDGLVCGRSLADGQWTLNLLAQKSAEITDVDVDPDGRWIAIAATDGTVCVWCLCTERKVFEGSHKSLAVHCVKFRPIATSTEMGTEILLASGDAAGNLLVWRLTAPRGGDRSVIASRSAISSNAAGCGGSGFVCLAWSADGGTLAGLSDRLCSWRLITRANAGSAVGGSSGSSYQLLDRSRVVRVFDTIDRRNRLFVSCASPGSPYLPSTFIVLEVHSGICFVFDPIEMIAPSTSNTAGDSGGIVAAGGVSAPAAMLAAAPINTVLSDVTSMLNKP